MKRMTIWLLRIAGPVLTALASLSHAAGVEVPSGTVSGEIISPHATTQYIEMTLVSEEYTATKEFSNTDVYEMRAPGGDWDYDVTARLDLLDSTNDGRVTRVNPDSRTITIGEGESVTNNYDITGNVVVHLNIEGDSYDSWAWYRYVHASGSSILLNGTQVQPRIAVQPAGDISVRGEVRVTGTYSGFDEQYTKEYDFITDEVEVGPYEVRHVHVTITHEEPEPPCRLTDTCPEPPDCEDDNSCPAYGFLHLSGQVYMNNPGDFQSWRLSIPGGWSRSDSEQPWFDRTEQVVAGRKVGGRISNLRYHGLDGNGSGLLLDPVIQDRAFTVEEGQTVDANFDLETGRVLTHINLQGHVPQWMEGMSMLSQKNGNLPGSDYYWAGNRNFNFIADPYADETQSYLSPGYWLVGRNFSSSRIVGGGRVAWSAQTGGGLVEVAPGSSSEVWRNVCFGETTIRYRDKAGGDVTVTRVNGNGRNAEGDLASFNDLRVRQGGTVEVVVQAPEADYTANASLQLEDGTRITPPAIDVPVQCGVRSCTDPDAPVIVILGTPEANLVTNAETIEVSGTATDDNGVAEVTVNGHQATLTPTGNQGEVGFSYTLPLDEGENVISAIAVNGENYSCFNERSVFVDRWMPEVRIEAPEDGFVYSPGEPIGLSAVGEDRGYGYVFEVLVDGEVIASVQGRADDRFATIERVLRTLTFESGAHTISARVEDRAGNVAEASVTVQDNRPPVADAGADRTIEATGEETVVTLDGSGSYDPDGDALTYSWSGAAAAQGVSPAIALPLGVHTFELSVTDGKGGHDTDTVTLTVVDTTAPEIDVEMSGAALWPPNHKMVSVISSISVDDQVDGSPQVRVSVSSNEADDGKGSGSTAPDWLVTRQGDSYSVSLRAERSGKGEGRTYQVTITAVDASGNESSWQEVFTVAHDKGRR